MSIRAVAILETMWDWRSMTSEAGYAEAPRYFRINPKNYTGGRLYKLIGPDCKLLVTNACRELVNHASKHGKPNPIWLNENLRRLDGESLMTAEEWHGIDGIDERRHIDLLLVCGRVAQQTYKQCGYTPKSATVIEIPHPAARGYWTKQAIEARAKEIQGALN